MKNLILIQPNAVLKKIYPRAVWNMDRSKKNIYLTFDDGPIEGLTEWVLDELRSFGVKATFFCVGANIQRNPQIFERIRQEGHVTANHTMHHHKGFKMNVAEYMKEVDECRQLVGNNLFRPPYGQMKRSQYRSLIQKGYKIVLWDVISYDYEKSLSPEKCTANVLDRTKNGSIVIFHDNLKAENNMKFALPVFLKHFLEKGYQFSTFPVDQPALAL